MRDSLEGEQNNNGKKGETENIKQNNMKRKLPETEKSTSPPLPKIPLPTSSHGHCQGLGCQLYRFNEFGLRINEFALKSHQFVHDPLT